VTVDRDQTDARFMRNVREARESGYDLICAECGCGIYDDADDHDPYCSQNPELAENIARRDRWIAKQTSQGSA
jgi:hypothetical protein